MVFSSSGASYNHSRRCKINRVLATLVFVSITTVDGWLSLNPIASVNGPSSKLHQRRSVKLHFITPLQKQHPSAGELTNERTTRQQLTSGYDDIVAGVVPIIAFLAYCVAMTIAIISWEDITCKNALPSRHRTELLAGIEQMGSYWGRSTIYGMGFGFDERRLLQSINTGEDEVFQNLLSYNEIMLNHRTITVPQWRKAQSIVADIKNSNTNDLNLPSSIHTVVNTYQVIKVMQKLANDYQWEDIRVLIRSSTITDLSHAAAVIRSNINHKHNNNYESADDVIGFDWGSCSWRHCGAMADIEESLDELDYLLGVLEPYEAVFCLDIAERALRDIMTVIPWHNSNKEDAEFWRKIPAYESIVKVRDDEDDSDELSRIDQAYFKALQELRID